MTDKYYTDEKIEELHKRFNDVFNQKSSHEPLWQKIAQYCGLNKYFHNEKQNHLKTDTEINNSSAIISLNQSSDSMLGILIGDGNFFKLKVKDKIEEIIRNKTLETEDGQQLQLNISKHNLDKYMEFVNFVLREQFFSKDSNFVKNLQKTIREYFAFGNGGMGVFRNNSDADITTDFSASHLEFVNYSINNCAFLEGRNGNINDIFLKYNWNSKRIVETFCMENNIFNEEKFNDLPDIIKGEYKNHDFHNNHEIAYLFMLNPEKRKEAKKGIYNTNYVGLFIDFNNKYIYKKEYFKRNHIKIIRDNIKTGETYGKGLAANIISEIELLNKITGDAIENIENITEPYLAIYENILTGNKIELDRNKPLVLKSDENNPNPNPPIFPVIQPGDVSHVIQILLPMLQQNITTALKTDVFLDFNAKSSMTATETQIRSNIRNKILFANALDFQNLLNNLIYNSYHILFDDDFYDRKDNVIEYLEKNNIDWFDIEYTSELAQIQKNSEIQNILSYINTMANILTLAPAQSQQEIIKKIDFNAIADRVASIYNHNDFIIDEETFKKKIEAEQQAMVQQSQMQNELIQADILNKNTQALKNQREAMASMGGSQEF